MAASLGGGSLKLLPSLNTAVSTATVPYRNGRGYGSIVLLAGSRFTVPLGTRLEKRLLRLVDCAC